MNKINFKSKFSFFNKNDAYKFNNSETSSKETINKNSTWFQTMEPIIYAKNQTKKLYEIDDISINELDSKIFRDLLFKKLKIQIDNHKELIKNKFLKTSDGSLNVGLNVILIDSLLRVIIKNSYFHIFGIIDYQISLLAVVGY